MFFNSPRFISLLALLSTLTSIISAVPNLGVQKDFAAQFPREGYQSYSTIVKFNDASIPGDQSKISDAQFINLAKVAYNEMIAWWSRTQLASDGCPGAMIAMESEGIMYFASSVRSPNGIDINALDRNVQQSIGWYQWMCQMSGGGTHKTGGRCAEPNVLRLYGDLNGIETTPTNPLGTYRPLLTTDTSPRIAVWGRPSGALPNQNKESFFKPCADTATGGYGCNRMATQYGLKSVSRQSPDPSGQDGWAFTLPGNPRAACPAPPT